MEGRELVAPTQAACVYSVPGGPCDYLGLLFKGAKVKSLKKSKLDSYFAEMRAMKERSVSWENDS